MVTVQLAQLTTRHMSPLNYMLYTPFTFFHMLPHVVSHALSGVGWKVCVRREVGGGGPAGRGGGGRLGPNFTLMCVLKSEGHRSFFGFK